MASNNQHTYKTPLHLQFSFHFSHNRTYFLNFVHKFAKIQKNNVKHIIEVTEYFVEMEEERWENMKFEGILHVFWLLHTKNAS